MRFEYRRADNVEHALKLITDAKSRFIAGGTDILVNIKNGVERPGMLVDIGEIGELREIRDLGNAIEVGAAVTHAQVARSALLRQEAPILVDACCAVGSPQIRSRGTIGGNLITASPSGDTIPALFCLGGVVRVRNTRGERDVPIEEFFVDVKKTIIEPEELLVSVRIEKPKENTKYYYAKLGQRKALAISKTTVAMRLRLGENLVVEDMRIALGAVAKTAIRARRTEQLLLHRRLNSARISEAESLAQAESRAIDDIRSTSTYRNQMVGVLLARGLRTLAAQ